MYNILLHTRQFTRTYFNVSMDVLPSSPLDSSITILVSKCAPEKLEEETEQYLSICYISDRVNYKAECHVTPNDLRNFYICYKT